MRIISRKRITDFYDSHFDAKNPLEAWFREAKNASWASPAEIKAQYGNASILKNKMVVFNIGGNKYRLAVNVLYEAKIVYIKFVGTHKEYDAIDLEAIK